jgi:hypothetical protein
VTVARPQPAFSGETGIHAKRAGKQSRLKGAGGTPVSPLPSSAAGFAIGVRDWFRTKPCWAAPAMSVAATETAGRTGRGVH